MASISKLQKTKDGKRYWRIQVSRGRGKTPYSMNFYWPEGYTSQKLAERELNKAAAEFEADCKAGNVLNNEQKRQKAAAEKEELAKLKTVKAYGEGVYMAAKKLELAETTRNGYQQMLDLHIYPVIGNTLLVDVTPAMLKKLILDFQNSGAAVSSARTMYCVLHCLFEMAFQDDSIKMNPLLKVPKPKQRKDAVIERECDKALDEEGLLYVLECVQNEPLKWQAYINLSADTGARRGELCGLQWKDFDFKKGTVTIQRSLQYTPTKGVYIANPKNGKSRVVDIGTETIALLKSLRKEQTADHVSKWVFTIDGSADPMHPDSPTRYFTKFAKRYNIEGFHPHLLRHTSASLAITNGADVVSTAARLGHSDTAITLRMYAHANEESIRRAGQSVRDALDRKRAEKQKKAEGQ